MAPKSDISMEKNQKKNTKKKPTPKTDYKLRNEETDDSSGDS